MPRVTDVAIGAFKIMGGRALGTPGWADPASSKPDTRRLGSYSSVGQCGRPKHTGGDGPSIT